MLISQFLFQNLVNIKTKHNEYKNETMNYKFLQFFYK